MEAKTTRKAYMSLTHGTAPTSMTFPSATEEATYAADVNVDYAVHLLHRGLFERFRNSRAGIVHKHIQSAEGCDGLFDRIFDCFNVGSVRLDRNGLSAAQL